MSESGPITFPIQIDWMHRATDAQMTRHLWFLITQCKHNSRGLSLEASRTKYIAARRSDMPENSLQNNLAKQNLRGVPVQGTGVEQWSVRPPAGSHSDAVAVKFCRRFKTLDRWRSDLWQTTTVPPCCCVPPLLVFPLELFPIRVPNILDTENFLVFVEDCSARHSVTRNSKAWYKSELFSATLTS